MIICRYENSKFQFLKDLIVSTRLQYALFTRSQAHLSCMCECDGRIDIEFEDTPLEVYISQEKIKDLIPYIGTITYKGIELTVVDRYHKMTLLPITNITQLYMYLYSLWNNPYMTAYCSFPFSPKKSLYLHKIKNYIIS